MKLQAHVHELSLHPTIDEKLDLIACRQHLQNCMDSYSKLVYDHLDVEAIDASMEKINNITSTEILWEGPADPDIDLVILGMPAFHFDSNSVDPEKLKLIFPSLVPEWYNNTPNICLLRNKETKILEGQACDSIDAIKEVLVYMSWEFTTKVCQAKNNRQTARAWKGVKILKRTLQHHHAMYNFCRRKLWAMGSPAQINTDFPPLTDKDCEASSSVGDPNAPGQRNKKLSWIWKWMGPSSTRFTRLNANPDLQSIVDYQQECRFLMLGITIWYLYFIEVYRIHWIHARAQRNRWSEELNLTEHEMEWTVRFYMYMAKLWASQRDANAGDPGLCAYAEQLMDMWNELGRIVDRLFLS